MSRNPASWYYWDDHHKEVEDEPLEIDGAWRRILYKCHWARERGIAQLTLAQWARVLGVDNENAHRILQYIFEKGLGNFRMLIGCGIPVQNEIPFEISPLGKLTLSRNPNIIIEITNRRMVKECKTKESNRKRQIRHRYKQKNQEQPNA